MFTVFLKCAISTTFTRTPNNFNFKSIQLYYTDFVYRFIPLCNPENLSLCKYSMFKWTIDQTTIFYWAIYDLNLLTLL